MSSDTNGAPRSHAYDPATIEPRWQAYWAEHETFKAVEDPSREKFYALGMFRTPRGLGCTSATPRATPPSTSSPATSG